MSKKDKIIIGDYVRQPQGYSAFIPRPFPPHAPFEFSNALQLKHTAAVHVIGKLDGIAELLPDKDCFLKMFVLKDASSSSNIEGTNATMMDAIEHENEEPGANIPADVSDIVHYIEALNYGLKRAKEFPFSLRFVRELHKELMIGARATQHAYPGEFRKSQNWIAGTKPEDAQFVPPPPPEVIPALGDLEKFVHYNNEYQPLVKAGLLHAQFETIHPFNDGNGRTGRMLITMFLWQNKLLGMPVLYLSSFFNKHKKLYYERLDSYHEGRVEDWLDFFLEGIIKTAESAIRTCAGITSLHERDIAKIAQLGKTSAASTMTVLEKLYGVPKVGIADIIKWTRMTPNGAYKLIGRMVDMGILYPMKPGNSVYGQKWIYKDYLDLFDAG